MLSELQTKPELQNGVHCVWCNGVIDDLHNEDMSLSSEPQIRRHQFFGQVLTLNLRMEESLSSNDFSPLCQFMMPLWSSIG